MQGRFYRRWGTLAFLLGTLMLRPALANADGYLFTGPVYLEGMQTGQSLITTQPFTVEISGGPPANSSTVGSGNVITQSFVLKKCGNSFPYISVPAGVYTVRVKGPLWLEEAINNVKVLDGASTNAGSLTLPAGDANNDNSVDSSDFNILIGAYNSSLDTPGSGYDTRADFNQDRSVDSSDFTLLIGEFNNVGAPYQVVIDTPTQDGMGKVTLTWHLIDASGQPMAPPTGTTFSVFHPAGHDYAGSSRNAIRVSGMTYTDGLPNLGPNYYQVLANLPGGYAVSREVMFLPSNPLIENRGSGVYRITGFKPDYSGLTYQAKVTNGLLNSYKVNNRELFHTNPATGATIPIQFAAAGSFRNLTGGNVVHGTVTTTGTLQYSVSDSGGLNTNLTYTPTPTNLQMTLNVNKPLSFCLLLGSEHDATAQEAVSSVQNLIAPGQGFARLPGSGLVYSLPRLPFIEDSKDYDPIAQVSQTSHITSLRTMRYYLGGTSAIDSAVDFTYILNDGGNPKDDGMILPHLTGNASTGYASDYSCWGRDFGSGYIQFTLTPSAFSAPTKSDYPLPLRVNPTPSFHLVLPGYSYYSHQFLVNGLGMYKNDINNQLSLQLQIKPGQNAQGYHFTYYFTDFWGRTVGNKTYTRDLPATYNNYPGGNSPALYQYLPLQIPLPVDSGNQPLTGYFRLVGSLTPVGNQDPTLIKNQAFLDFGVYNALGKAPYIHDVSDMPANSPNLLNLTGEYVLSQSDPGIPYILGIRSLRVENKATTTKYSNGASPSSPPPFTNTFIGNNTPNTNAIYALSMFSKPMGLPLDDRQDDIVLFGSIAPKIPYGAPYNNFDFEYNALDMVASLTLYDTNAAGSTLFDTQPNGAQTARASNPIKYWSLYNEPDAEHGIFYKNQILGFANPTDSTMMHGRQGILEAYSKAMSSPSTTPAQYTAAPHNVPVLIGPNLVTVGTSSLDVDGNGKIIFNGPLSWWDAFFADGGGQTIDAVGTHTYTGNDRSWEEHGIAENLHALRLKMDQTTIGNGGLVYKYPDAAGKDIWLTEHGWSWNWSADMPRLQADYIVRQYALAAQQSIRHEHNAYYFAANINYYNFYLWDGDLYANSQFHGAPLRGGMAMRVLNEKTAGMSFDSHLALNTGKYVHAVPYTDGTNETIIVWGNDFTDPQLLPDGHQIYPVVSATQPEQTVTLPLKSNDSALVFDDIMGNPITVVSNDNHDGTFTYLVPATGSPVYVLSLNGNTFSIADGGWPALTNRTNYALPENGGSATVSTSATSGKELFTDHAGAHYLGGDAAALNDKSWQYDDLSGSLPFDDNNRPTPHLSDYSLQSDFSTLKSAWIGGADYTQVGQQSFTPDSAAITFASPKTIDTIVAVAPSSNNSGGGLPGVRDYNLQITTDGTNWQTMKSVAGNTSEWVLYANFPAVANVKGVRIQIIKVNNGRWFDDYNSYLAYQNGVLKPYYGSALHATLYELEAYGP